MPSMPTAPAPALAPLASLAAHWQACTGDVPPALVGASVTLVDDPDDASKARLYLFGGRLVTTRRMVNDMYELDMTTLKWSRLFSEQDASTSSTPRPQPRYFHSCNLWDGRLVIFGGMGYVKGGSEADLCVLNETVAFDFATRSWELNFVAGSEAQFQASDQGESSPDPQPRYAHLASISGDSLVIVGGQDLGNSYVEEINILDLKQRQWTARLPFHKQRGSYRSLAVEPQWNIAHASAEIPVTPGVGKRARAGSVASQKQPLSAHPLLGPETISFLPTSTREYDEHGGEKALPIYVYTNYNFTDVKREMEVMHLTTDGDGGDEHPSIRVDDRSGEMTGLSLPPGLRFPMGAILGSHLLISGTYLANTSQTFAVWALHLPSMAWTRLDVGTLLSTGSWNRGVLWPSQSRLAIFGHRDRDLVADYNHRQTNWDHVLCIELDAWGICQPPIFHPNRTAVELGLEKLASSAVGSFNASLGQEANDSLSRKANGPTLFLGGRGDFEIVCSDGMRLGCDRAILESRWPWFAKQLQSYRSRLRCAGKGLARQRSADVLASLPEEGENGSAEVKGRQRSASLMACEPRITPRQLVASEPSPVMLAILTYLYTGCICTRLQRHPAIVAALLVASRMYEMDDLARWAQYAAHVALSTTLAPLMPGFPEPLTPHNGSSSSLSQDAPLPPLERHRLAVAIYEAATLSGFEALQIRALRSVMAIAKWVQRISTSSRSSSIAGLDSGSMDKDRLQERRRQASLALSPSRTKSTSSPHGSRRSSVSTSDGQPPSAYTRRDSRSERLAQLRDAEDSNGFRDAGQPTNSFYTPNSSFPSSLNSTRRPSTISLQASGRGTTNGTSGTVGSSMPPSPLKPSHSTTGSSAMAPPPPSATGRKRFSIFGRSSDASKQASVSNAHEQIDDDAASSSSGPSAWGGKPRMQRVHTDTGAPSSLLNAQGSTTPLPTPSSATHERTASNGHDMQLSGGTNGSAGARESTQWREGSISAATGGPSSAARRMTATLGRFKSATMSATNSVSASPLQALDAGPANDGIQPLRPAPAHVPTSARSSVATTATLTTSSSNTATPPASSAGRQHPRNNNASLPTGSLSDNDIKALQSIWA